MDKETQKMVTTLEKTISTLQKTVIKMLMKSGMTEEEAWREHDRLYAEAYLERLEEQWREKHKK